MFSSQNSQVSSSANYIEDVFSTYIYTGTGANRTITNNIDLSTKGGLTWIKSRDFADNHNLFDTERGSGKYLISNATNAQATDNTRLSAFTTSGFSLGTNGAVNGGDFLYSSWTFRKQPKFFDVVTFTQSSATGYITVNHNLGSTPGCIMVKRTDASGDWYVYHRSLGTSKVIFLNYTDAAQTETDFPSVTSTSFEFTNFDVGAQYVAYLFANDAGGFGLTGTDNVISCGSFTTDGSGNATVSLGYEAQWVLMKKSSGAEGWMLFDNMRGLLATVGANGYSKKLVPNLTDAESDGDECRASSTGFNVGGVVGGATYVYVAIRRGPMKVPTSGTSVFSPIARTGTGSASTVSNGITTDLIISHARNAVYSTGVWDRLRGFSAYLETTGTATESTSSDSVTAMNNAAYVLGADSATDRINRSGDTYANWTFSRAPNFFDEVCYTGTATQQNITHNLGIAPQLLIVKRRSGTGTDWATYAQPLGANYDLQLNSTGAATTGSQGYWANTTPTSSVFTVRGTGGGVNDVNTSGGTYVAYLFATCVGVSKVGSYTGTGTTKQIDCGFTGGARFVLIKRTDSTGNWYIWDTARGIVSGNDPYLLLNTTDAEVTSTDYIDPYSAGFEISSTAPAAINANGGTFIFLAIA